MWLLLAFVAVPLIEIALFIQVGGWLTLWPTLGIVLLTGIIGTVLVRRQGIAVIAALRRGLDGAGDPLSPLAHGAMILFAGALLLTPGFFTDAVGFLLLVPAARRAAIAALARRVRVLAPRPAADPSVIDADWYEVSPGTTGQEPGPRRPSGWTRP